MPIEYKYAQNYGGYGYQGIGQPTMSEKGCVITCKAMILSFFNEWLSGKPSPFYPDQMLKWDREHGGVDHYGNTVFAKLCEAAGGKLRMSTSDKMLPGESVVYGLRKVWFQGRFGQEHWVIDHPLIGDKIIDPWDGKVKDFASQKYAGVVYYYIGRK